MSLLQERFDRRKFLRGTATTVAGLAGAALIGCEGSNPDDLIQALLTTPFTNDELPSRIIQRKMSLGSLDDQNKAMQAIGKVDLTVADREKPAYSSGGISYIVFKDPKGPKQAMILAKNEVPDNQPASGSGLPSSSVLFDTDGLSICFTPVDNVLVGAFHSSFAMAVELEKSAISHLKKVK